MIIIKISYRSIVIRRVDNKTFTPFILSISKYVKSRIVSYEKFEKL